MGAASWGRATAGADDARTGRNAKQAQAARRRATVGGGTGVRNLYSPVASHVRNL